MMLLAGLHGSCCRVPGQKDLGKMFMERPYYRFSSFLKQRYGCKVYKLPVNLPVSCPNRDGTLAKSGCSFCGEEGAGFEILPSFLSVSEQLLRNSSYIGENYNANKFIAYFQNYSNTFLPLDAFKEHISGACRENIAALYISTRPDCINDRYLEFLSCLGTLKKIDIVIELGLQSVNYHTLHLLKRGHGLAELIDAVLRIKKFGLGSCAHYMVDLPMDNMEDVVEGARIISALGVDQVKCHSLFILKNTEMGDLYEKGMLIPVAFEEYLERVISFLEQLNPGIVIQRLLGRAPRERTLFCNWGMSWWKIHELVEKKMEEEGKFQGRLFNYLNGERCLGTG